MQGGFHGRGRQRKVTGYQQGQGQGRKSGRCRLLRGTLGHSSGASSVQCSSVIVTVYKHRSERERERVSWCVCQGGDRSGRGS